MSNEKEIVQGGSLANKNGKVFEKILTYLFNEYGYIEIKNQSEEKENINVPKYFIRNAKYTTIYNHKGKTEFLLVNNNLSKRIRIECKWQQSQGSVDEKYPYLYLNCIYAFEEQEIILIIDGSGMKTGALEWLKNKVKENWLNENNKNIQVMNLNEFITWFNNLHK